MQRSTDAFYEGNVEEGAGACRTILNAIGVPDHIRELTYQNQIYYAQPLHEMVPGASWPPLSAPVPVGWTMRDPSPVVVDDRVTILLRAVRDAGVPEADDCPWVIHLDSGPTPLVILREATDDGRQLTEMRPVFHDGALHVSAVIRTPDESQPARAGVFFLSNGGPSELRLFGPRYGDFRQGWSPFITPTGPCFVAWWEPTEIVRLVPETNDFAQVAQRMAPHIAERFRGGSPGVSTPGGYLFLINETATFAEGTKVDLSRFVRVNADFQITDISPQFFVTERGNDFATGLARLGDQLIAGFASGSRQTLLMTMDLDSVLRLLIPVTAPGRRASASAGK
jgi:hypothetical protein